MNWYDLSAIFFKILNCFLFLALFYYFFVKKIRPALYEDIALEEEGNLLLHNQITALQDERRNQVALLTAAQNEEELLRHKLMFWSARVEYGAFLAEKDRADRLIILREREHIKQDLYVKNRLFHTVLPIIHERVLRQATMRFADKEQSAQYLDHILDFLDKQGE